jgi:hypothetical protein
MVSLEDYLSLQSTTQQEKKKAAGVKHSKRYFVLQGEVIAHHPTKAKSRGADGELVLDPDLHKKTKAVHTNGSVWMRLTKHSVVKLTTEDGADQGRGGAEDVYHEGGGVDEGGGEVGEHGGRGEKAEKKKRRNSKLEDQKVKLTVIGEDMHFKGLHEVRRHALQRFT